MAWLLALLESAERLPRGRSSRFLRSEISFYAVGIMGVRKYLGMIYSSELNVTYENTYLKAFNSQKDITATSIKIDYILSLIKWKQATF